LYIVSAWVHVAMYALQAIYCGSCCFKAKRSRTCRSFDLILVTFCTFL